MRLGGIIDASEAAADAAVRAAAPDQAAAELTQAALAADGPMQVTVRGAGRADAIAGADALETRIAGLIRQPAASLTVEDWQTLRSALAADPGGSRLVGPRTAFDAPDLRLVVDQVLLGHEESVAIADRYLAAWRAARTGPEAMAAQAQTQLTRWPGALTPDDWRALRAVVDADPTGEITKVPPQARREYAGLRQSIVDFADGRGGTVDERQIAQFKRWVRDNDPSYPARWKDAVDAAAGVAGGGKLSWDQFYTLRLEAENFEELGPRLAAWTPAQRREALFYVADRNRYALASWMQRHDAEYEPMLRESIDAIAAGTELNALQSALVSTAKDRVDELVAGRPLAEQRTIVDRLLSGTARNDWLRANVPDWDREVETALDTVLEARRAGTYPDWKASGLLRDEGERLDAVLARRPYEEQLAYQDGTLREEQLIPWMQANDPDWAGTFARTLEQTLAGSAPKHGEAILRTGSARIDGLVAGKPWHQQEAIARAVLHPNDFYEWNHANNPEYRARAAAAVQRFLDGVPEQEGDGMLLFGERDRIDQWTAGLAWNDQVRLASRVLGEQSLYLTEWMARNNPDRAGTLAAAADAAIAGTATDSQWSQLYWLREELPDQVFAGRSVIDNLKLIQRVNGSGTASSWVEGWRAALEPELSRLQRQAAADAATGELSADARLLLQGERDRLGELTAGADYETSLRIADAVLDARSLQEWKVANDPDRVANVTRAVNAIADGTFTLHDMRVVRGERDVLGLVRDRPYAQQLPVAKVALDGGSIEYWKRAHDPEYQVRLGEAIDSAARGQLSDEAFQLISGDRINVFRLLADRTPREQAAVARVMLGRTGSNYEGELGAMRTLALDARTRLDAVAEVPELQALRDETSELLDRNIARMSGFNAGDPNPGYSVHPDYAEMGRVQANVELLEAVAKGRTSTASAQEVLSW